MRARFRSMDGVPNFDANACAGFSPSEQAKLWNAAVTYADSRGVVIRMTEMVGRSVQSLGRRAANVAIEQLGPNWRKRIEGLVEEALWRGYDLATLGLDPARERAPRRLFNKALASASGAVTGFTGGPGLALDIPLTTGLILRSIATIARAHGEDIASDEGKRACLQVFAFGGPEAQEEPEIGYWTTRAALSHGGIAILIRQTAARLGIPFSEKLLGQLLPGLGALSGGALNFVFMDYYQRLAVVHFTIRQLERSHPDPSGVRACFDNLVRQARERRRTATGVGRPALPPPDPKPTVASDAIPGPQQAI